MSISLTIKLSNADKATVIVARDATVLDLKEAIALTLSVPATQQRLIFKGRVLKDELTMDHYGIENENTVHMVKGSASGSSSTPSSGSNSTTTQPTFSAPPPNRNPSAIPPSPFGLFGDMGGGMPDVSRMQDQLMRNPEMMQQIMNSPMMENLLNNPDLMRNMMLNNPQMQSMLDSNPQIRHILNDPAVLRQSMEMMRNPNAMQQAMRSQDLAMSQLENLPGGFNALRRMYEEVQEPMMEASQNASAAAQSTTSNNSSTNNANLNSSALPNPWGANGNPSGGLGDMGAFGGLGGLGADPFGMGMMGGMGGSSPFGGGMPPVDPSQMAQMMQNPMVQQAMQQMMSDPNALQQMSMMNPQLGAALQNPQVRNMLSNPDFIRQMSNPNTMQAVMQMQQSMQALQGTGLAQPPAFNPYANMFGGGMMGGLPTPLQSAPPAGGLDFSTLFRAPGNPAPIATPPATQEDPRMRYASQLQQLQDMGFLDSNANLQELLNTGGNVNAAVERLLGSR
eukprot:gene7254-9890_t